ncbi:TonB-dependent receptor, beta-barrel domain protein [Candidatus Magnetoovum chiemensis]|nr:TonB-dependent receptor, beta-barrel domain protein [Candidatus Magnetoovum chiemensis]
MLGVLELQNAAKAESAGIEAELKIKLPYGFQTDFNYTYQNVKFTDFNIAGTSLDNNHVPFIPANQFGTTISWTNKNIGLLSASVLYVDDKYIDIYNNSNIAGYTLVDLKYTYKYKNMDINLAVNNIFDKTYAIMGEAYGGLYLPTAGVYPGYGRAFYVELKYRLI